MTTDSARDVQRKIGPSDLADPCNKCLGSKMAGIKPKREFSMYPWLGSAIHYFIEYLTDRRRFKLIIGQNELAHNMFAHPDAESEVYIENAIFIPGYGWIPMHADFVLPAEGAVVDWKSSSLKKVRVYKVKDVSEVNVGQVLLYICGLRNNGYSVDRGVLVYIPRDTGDLTDLWAREVPYDEAEVQSMIDRGAVIYKYVEQGIWQDLDSDPDCFTCNPGYGR